MNNFKKYTLFFIVFSLFLSCKENKIEQKAMSQIDEPNIIIIIADDMNGYAIKDQYPLIKAPYLDKLRAESVNFVNAACNTPVCNPSRSSFFSGLYPHHTGAYINGSDGWNRSEILQNIRNLPEYFRDNGYETWGAGKLFHNPFDSIREAGFWDNYPVYKGGFGPFPEKEYWYAGSRFRSIKPWDGPDTDFPDVKNANAAIDFLKKKHEKPFLMVYGLWRPHSPYTAPKRFFDLYDEKDFDLPESYKEGDLDDVPFLGQMLVDSLNNYRNKEGDYKPLLKKFLYAYAANYSFADDNIGRVIHALDSSKYARNTLVVFYSDNGFHNGEKLRWGKATLWEQADYVPLMIRTPEKKGATSEATVSLIDVFPTLVDYAGLPQPGHKLDGNSLMSLVENPGKDWPYPSLTSYGVEYSSVRSKHHRYLRYPDGSEEFYDHQNDPYEWNNLASDPQYRTIMDSLKTYIPKDWAPSLGGRLEVPRKLDEVMRPSMKKAPGAQGS